MTEDRVPELTVLIASRDRRDRLRRCLEALRQQTADPATFDVIVADDGSTDGTSEMLAGFEARFRLRVLPLTGVGKYRAINAVIESATGSACLVLDDDVIGSSELIAAHLAAHREEPRTLGIGPLTQVPPPARDWYARVFASGWDQHFSELERRPADWTDCYGGNFSAPRAALLEVGGFPTDMTNCGDFEIGLKLTRAGCIPRFLSRAHGIHDDGKRWRKMIRDLELQARGYVVIADRHPEVAERILDWADGAGPIELRLRRILIAARVPAQLLVPPGALLPGAGRKMIWFHFVRGLALWSAIRRQVDTRRWALLTRGPSSERGEPPVLERT